MKIALLLFVICSTLLRPALPLKVLDIKDIPNSTDVIFNFIFPGGDTLGYPPFKSIDIIRNTGLFLRIPNGVLFHHSNDGSSGYYEPASKATFVFRNNDLDGPVPRMKHNDLDGTHRKGQRSGNASAVLDSRLIETKEKRERTSGIEVIAYDEILALTVGYGWVFR